MGKKQLNHFKLFSLMKFMSFCKFRNKIQIINDYKNYIVKMYKDRNEVSNSSLIYGLSITGAPTFLNW